MVPPWLNVCPDDFGLHWAYREFNSHRWGGSDARVLGYAEAMGQSDRFDTQVPWRAINALNILVRDAKQFYNTNVFAGPLKKRAIALVDKVTAGCMKSAPRLRARYVLIQAAAHYNAGDRPAAAKLVASLERAAMKSYLEEFGITTVWDMDPWILLPKASAQAKL